MITSLPPWPGLCRRRPAAQRGLSGRGTRGGRGARGSAGPSCIPPRPPHPPLPHTASAAVRRCRCARRSMLAHAGTTQPRPGLGPSPATHTSPAWEAGPPRAPQSLSRLPQGPQAISRQQSATNKDTQVCARKVHGAGACSCALRRHRRAETAGWLAAASRPLPTLQAAAPTRNRGPCRRTTAAATHARKVFDRQASGV